METAVFTTHQWLVMMGGVLCGAVTMVLIAFRSFVTRKEYERELNSMEKWMVRIETKIDQLLSKERIK